MDINLYVNGKKINPLYKKAIAEYIKRLSPYCSLSLVCAPGRIKFNSGKNNMNFVIGDTETISSEEFARQINDITTGGVSKINYYIGYPQEQTSGMNTFAICSISPESDMTALLLSEQIYRAYTILNNITYHK